MTNRRQFWSIGFWTIVIGQIAVAVALVAWELWK
jgi:hypothetical protein